MDTLIKKREYTQVNKNMELLATKVILQFNGVEELLINGWKEEIQEQFIENEKTIDNLKTEILYELTNLVVLFTPRAADLRKIVSYHEVVLSLERIGDLLLDIIHLIKEVNLTSSDYNDFKQTLKKMILSSKEMVNASVYSFFKDDSNEAYKILHKRGSIEEFSKEIAENLVSSFQEIDLTGQELLNIIHLNNIAYIVKKIEDHIINIIKSTIFATEGIDIKHSYS